MTEPTDAELKALLLEKLPASKHYIRPVIEKMVAAMQAAIAKWGQPAQAAEPVSHQYQSQDGTWHEFIDQRHYNNTVADGRFPIRTLYTTPQPVAREPLTNEHIRAMLNKHPPEDVCDWSYRMGIDDAELHHGIKGGQHGSE